MNQASHIIAICYIAKDQDESNKCSLSKDQLYITRKGKPYSFELDQITQIAFKQKKLLFPLILGGVVGSLFLIAGFNFLINIWLAMIIGLAGVLLFYYGWVGSEALVIHTKVKEYDIFISKLTPSLQAFIAMVNENFILGKSKSLRYYFSLTESTWEKAASKGYINIPNDGLRLTTIASKSQSLLTFSIDPLEVPNPINYKMDETSKNIIPYVFGQLNIDHIHRTNN